MTARNGRRWRRVRAQAALYSPTEGVEEPENFWSLLKRSLSGTYVRVEPFHLFRYLDEQALRFNTREHGDGERFNEVLGQVAGRRLTYADLTGQTAVAC